MDLEENDLDYDEDTNIRRMKEVKLKDVYEPAVIAQKMLTEGDEIIRMTDIPERYQVRIFVITLTCSGRS